MTLLLQANMKQRMTTRCRHFAATVLTLVLVSNAWAQSSADHSAKNQLQWLGGSPVGKGNLDGPRTQASLGELLWLHADSDNRLFIVSQRDATIRSMDGAGNVTTLAGRAGRKGFVNGPANKARFDSPQDAVRGPDGKIYVADTGNHAIRIMSADGNVTTLAGQQGKGDARGKSLLDAPEELAFDAHGRLWVREHDGQLLIVATNGTVTAWSPTCQTECERISWHSLAGAPDGTIWLADDYHIARIVNGKFDKLDMVITSAALPSSNYAVTTSAMSLDEERWRPRDGGVGALIGKIPFLGKTPLSKEARAQAQQEAVDLQASLSYKMLAFDRTGVLYVLTGGGLQRLTPGAKQLETLTSKSKNDNLEWERLCALAITNDGRILLADNDPVIFTLDNKIPHPYVGTSMWQEEGEIGGVHWQQEPVEGVAGNVIAADGSVYFVDSLGSAIYRTTPDGRTTLWAGKHGKDGKTDGPRLDARFNSPSGLAIDAKGNLYVVDSGNASIRLIKPDGMVTTLAGHQGKADMHDGSFSEATFSHPHFIALDQRQHLYLLDENAGGSEHIRVLDLDQQQVKTVSGEEQRFQLSATDQARLAQVALRYATDDYLALATGPDGELYALSHDVIWRIDTQTGQRHIQFLRGPASQAEIQHEQMAKATESEQDREKLTNDETGCDWLWCNPEDMAIDRHGNMYVSDGGNNTVLRIDTNGKASLIAGQLGLRGNQPGALPGVLNKPSKLAMTPEGDLLIVVGNSGMMLLKNPASAPSQAQLQP